jgi:hypothetical protein
VRNADAEGKNAARGTSPVRAPSKEASPQKLGSASPRKLGSQEPSPGLKKEVSFSEKVDVKTEVQRKRSPVKQNGRPAKRVKSAA